jgi:dihydroorotate dehydrogenase
MITFSNGRKIQYFVASGALAFDTKGWPWEWLLVWLGLIDRTLFGIAIKSLTKNKLKGNLRWWKPWECVKLIIGGAVNKVGLTNLGFEWWMTQVAPKLDFVKYNIIVSLVGTEEELIYMVKRLNALNIVAIEINESCPNTGHPAEDTKAVIRKLKAVKKHSRHPVILKTSADQDGVALAEGLLGIIEAMSFNTLAWAKVFPGVRSPLWKLEKKVGGGGGGVSGKELQKHNWPFMKKIHEAVPGMPLIASSIMEYGDFSRADGFGCSAYSLGTIFLPDHPVWFKPWTIFTNPCKVTFIVQKHMEEQIDKSAAAIMYK